MTDQHIQPRALDAWLSMVLGSALLFFVGWQWNVPLAAWLAPLFLVRFFRHQVPWFATLLAIPVMFASVWLAMQGRWPMPVTAELATIGTRLLPLIIALYLDRIAAARLRGFLRDLVFPSAAVLGDYAVSLGPVGAVLSPASSQFAFTSLIQVTSVTGIWGLTFLMAWFATTVNSLWEHHFDLKRHYRPIVVYLCVLGVVLFLGSVRISQFRPAETTVRIAGVAQDFDNPYWAEVKKANPPEGKAVNAPGFAKLIDQLYANSKAAVEQGARIVFWAEGNAPMYEDDEDSFLTRARQFAIDNQVYFLPGMLVLHYNQVYAQNKAVLISPQGEILFDYEKTKTPKKTNSDGMLRYADTPYGRISASICFDMDFPDLANQLGDQGVDIMLVPSWDMIGIKPYHSDVGAFRAVENGFSSVRQVVKGASLAVDYQGNVLGYQDYFTVDNATMIADVPVKGIQTLYGRWGDWLVYLAALVVVVSAVKALFHGRRQDVS